MPQLILGPMLRYADTISATIWVETDRPCEVRVETSAQHQAARTFTVHGHHYAVVDIEDLAPGTATPYEITLDGEKVWPEPEAPPSLIRTFGAEGPVRLAFGSCRHPGTIQTHGFDALRAWAVSLQDQKNHWPTALLLVGDQVYSDRPPEAVHATTTRNLEEPPGEEAANFEEYTQLYRNQWTDDPIVRWLLSTVPSFMIFDDHDVRDDWNTSQAWHDEMAAQPWWQDKITGALGAYWIYQHVGNLSPEERAKDPVFQAITQEKTDRGEILDEFARLTDRQAETAIQWSYARDLGGTRLVVTDTRCGRVLEPGKRAMLHEPEMAWLDQQLRGDTDHLLIATSLPYLLPAGVHHGEAWNEALSAGAWGKGLAKVSERLRQTYDLEHWAAFDTSFRRVAEDVLATARGERGRAPESIAFLSGDVHFSYLARVTDPAVPVCQVVCSPLRNPLPLKIRLMNRIAARPVMAAPARAVARLARVRKPPLSWRITDGLWFKNAIATLELDGRKATVVWETPDSPSTLRELARAGLNRP